MLLESPPFEHLVIVRMYTNGIKPTRDQTHQIIVQGIGTIIEARTLFRVRSEPLIIKILPPHIVIEDLFLFFLQVRIVIRTLGEPQG